MPSRHQAPDALSHLYPPGDIRGRFTVLPGDGSPERACEGDIRLSWLPTPRIEVRGEYSPEPGDIEALLNSGADTKIWHTRLQVRLPDSAGVPSPQTEEARPWSRECHTGYLGPAEIYPPEIDDGTVLSRVTEKHKHEDHPTTEVHLSTDQHLDTWRRPDPGSVFGRLASYSMRDAGK